MNWKTTLSGLIAALGVACKNSTEPHVHALGAICEVIGIYLLGHHAQDASAVSSNAGAGVAKSLALVLLPALALGSVIGCVNLAPGADPIIVRAEQLETTADASFQLVLDVDGGNRDFYRTNAPAFHGFAEWLRQPQEISGTNYPRAVALVLSLDAVKVAYKSNRSDSNAVVTAIATLQSAVDQAAQWNAFTNQK